MDRGTPLARKEGPVAEIYLAQKAEVKSGLTVTRSNSRGFAFSNQPCRSLSWIERLLESYRCNFCLPSGDIGIPLTTSRASAGQLNKFRVWAN
jgi:hypothetical protein